MIDRISLGIVLVAGVLGAGMLVWLVLRLCTAWAIFRYGISLDEHATEWPRREG